MLETAGNLSGWPDGVFRARSYLWYLYWIKHRRVKTKTQLTHIIHAPGIHIALHGKRNGELLTHLDIFNDRSCSAFALSISSHRPSTLT